MMMAGKVAIITVASAGFGVAMQLFMSSNEYNMNSAIDHSRSHAS